MTSNDEYVAILLEELRDQNKAVLEAVSDIQRSVSDLPVMKHDIADLKQDMKVVKAAVTDMSHELKDHEARISRLEAA